MLIIKAQGKVPFEKINTIVVDRDTKRIIHSNHPSPAYQVGHPVDETVQRNAIKFGWAVIHRRKDKLLTEQVSTENLINNILLPDSESENWAVFEKGETMVFAQMRDGKVCVQDEQGEEKFYDDVQSLLKELPGFLFMGQISDEDIKDEIEGDIS